MINFCEKDGALVFDVRVIPRASRSEVVGAFAGALKVKLSSPPAQGAANKELVKLLSKEFGVAKTDVEIVKGLSSKTKKVSIKSGDPKILDAF